MLTVWAPIKLDKPLPLFIEVSVPRTENNRSYIGVLDVYICVLNVYMCVLNVYICVVNVYICVLNVSFFPHSPFSTIFLLDFGTVPTV